MIYSASTDYFADTILIHYEGEYPHSELKVYFDKGYTVLDHTPASVYKGLENPASITLGKIKPG